NDQVERAFALADRALARDQHAKPQNVHEDRVEHRAFRKRVFENRRQLGDRRRRDDGRPQQWKLRLLRLDDELWWWGEAARDQHAWKVVRQREPQRAPARGGVEALEIADLALPENQNASGLQVLVKP